MGVGLVVIENPRRGGLSCRRGGGGLRGQESVCGEFGGVGLNISFGAEIPAMKATETD